MFCTPGTDFLFTDQTGSVFVFEGQVRVLQWTRRLEIAQILSSMSEDHVVSLVALSFTLTQSLLSKCFNASVIPWGFHHHYQPGQIVRQ